MEYPTTVPPTFQLTPSQMRTLAFSDYLLSGQLLSLATFLYFTPHANLHLCDILIKKKFW